MSSQSKPIQQRIFGPKLAGFPLSRSGNQNAPNFAFPIASYAAEDITTAMSSSSEHGDQRDRGTSSAAEPGKSERTDGTASAADIKVLETAETNGEVESSEDNTEDGEVSSRSSKEMSAEAPPLPNEAIPPLPSEPPPAIVQEDDGWAPVWEESAQAFYFYNRFTGASQWTNPRVPEPSAPGVEASAPTPPAARPVGGYDPAIHGDYDPTAWYAQPSEPEPQATLNGEQDPYAATAAFNRFTGRFQNSDLVPENFNDENKSKRQMNAFFDVDAAANSHDGRSLKEERSGKKLTKQELKKFKEKRKAKKEEKRKAWLRD
ncbi:hypothetical protein D0Z07_7450 [Hyphodiscus hymeniophilus]|uniref:WW domain-containing protein n=1 Tax=Hyphodiscus hymeniophilus TaxID=353542 RepID=A0A9P7AUJ0_9HELO|nr:hypothetical protein D0Z07_7450 [Hyphodiscus hymeniophilus]